MTDSGESSPPEPSPPFPRETLSHLTQTTIALVQLTPAGTIVTATDALAELAGESRETLRGRPFTELLTRVPPPLESLLNEDTTNAESITVPLSVQPAAGEPVPVEAHLESVSQNGVDDVIVGTLYQRSTPSASASPWTNSPSQRGPGQETETAPAKAFVALADSLSDGIIVLDADSEIQYANPAVERILGYGPDELVGGSKLGIVPERLRETHLSALDRYLETGERNIDWEYVELPGQHKDGREIPLGISLNDFFFDGERYFVGLFRDISPRKEAEQALREREQLLNRYKEYTDDVLNAIDDTFYVLDTAGAIQRWNQRLCEVSGHDPEEIDSMHVLDLFDESDHEEVAAAIEDGFETGRTRVEADLVTRDGDAVPYELVAATLEDPDGNPVLAGIGRDITTRTKHRRRLEKSNERLEQFAYAASHDLQEPLRMVTSYLQLIERRYGTELDEDGEEFLEFAVDGAERMHQMIDGLLQYSRVNARGEPLEPVELGAVLDDVLADLELRIEESDAEVRVADLPRVAGDSSQLRQVFQNLLCNAIGYSGDGPPEIDISAEREGEMWVVAVEDDGIGIDPEHTDRIFEVFQRLHTHDEHSGTGLGLALSQRIIERHGGRIWAESAPGEGATFFVTLQDPTVKDQYRRFDTDSDGIPRTDEK